MSYSIGANDLLDDKFYEYEENGIKDDILDEFLDRRVYDNSYSPDKLEFNEFYHESDSMNADMNVNLAKYNIQSDSGQNFNPRVLNTNEYISPLEDNNSLMNDDNDEFQSNNGILNHNSTITDPTLDFSDGSDSNSKELDKKVLKSNDPNQNDSINYYELLRDEVSKLKFGKYDMKVTPDSIHPSLDLLDFSPAVMNALPYKLTISNLPDYSRVETQTKINFVLNPPPPQNLIHIPQDLISKNKFCLADDLSSMHPLILKNLLYMDCYVMTSNTEKSCNICPKCIKREQKRASRRRFGMDDNTQEDNSVHDLPQSTTGIIKNNPQSWADETMIKKAIMFNCKEIVSFPPPNGLNNEKSLKLNARIICYCRHHQEVEGFKLLFVLKNYEGEVVAKQLSTNIMIMDRKKPIASSISSERASGSSNLKVKMESVENDISQPISPNSIDELLDLTTNYSSERNLKRKKLSIDDSSNSVNNPMYNGSTNGFSPLSNSDTNTSINNHSTSKNVYHKTPSRIPQSLNSNLTNLPTILRIIPAEGPIRGGIEITLLGFNFNPNLSVKFGVNPALATHCWSETTIVTYLPPASQPGQVLVTFEDYENTLSNQQQQIFTYTDDTDKQLIELALQIVGLKMNGKLEDAKNIARRIVGNDNTNSKSNDNSPESSESQNITSFAVDNENENDQSTIMEWYNNAQDIVKTLTKLNHSTEDVLINFLKLVDLPNCPITIPNWQLANNQGQTLLHLSTIKNYKKLIKFLMNHGCKIDLQDNQGLTPLFYASINGQRDLIHLFINCKANYNLRLSNDKTIKDYCDLNVLDIFEGHTDERYHLIKSNSIDSLNSMFEVKGLHVSKMVPGEFNNDSEFADLEYSADYSESEEVDDEDDEIEESESLMGVNETITNIPISGSSESINSSSHLESEGLWQKVKKVFNASDDDLPNYNDLFPFGPSESSSKPKSEVERQLNDCIEGSSQSKFEANEAKEVLSDSSEDMIISYINHPRKTVENDKMLIFFWVPALLVIVSLFISISVIGYKFESIEKIKTLVRDGLGNLMVGNERIKRVFSDLRT